MGKKDNYKDNDKKRLSKEELEKKISEAATDFWGGIVIGYAGSQILRDNPELGEIRLDTKNMDTLGKKEEKGKGNIINDNDNIKKSYEYFKNNGNIYLSDIKKFAKVAAGNTKKILMNIWLCLSKVNAYSRKDLKEIEDNIFTVNGKELPEKERIRIEILRISRYDNSNKKIAEEVTKLRKLYRDDYEEKRDFIKKEIVRIEALLGMNIAFLSTSLEVAKEETRLIDMEIEKVKTKTKNK